jgi:uncharacterized protein YtpQ (UPF0354 family)
MFGLFRKKAPKVELDPSQLVPRIKHADFLDQLRASGIPEEQMPVVEPLVGDLLVTYAFDMPDTFVMATPPLLAKAGVPPGSPRELALTNLRRICPDVSVQRLGSVYRFAMDGNYDACALLSDQLWRNQGELISGEAVACVPARDLLLFCDSNSPEGLEQMADLARDAFLQAAQHALSRQLLRKTDQGWELFESA